MDEKDLLAEQFEAQPGASAQGGLPDARLAGEADDAVQEAWLRLSRADAGGIDNLGGWLTTVVARVCLDMLRSRKSRREEPMERMCPNRRRPTTPSRKPLLAGLGRSRAARRAADAGAGRARRVRAARHVRLPFDEIAPIVGRSAAAARQLASRARRRVQGKPAVPERGDHRQQEVVDAFLAASRSGDFEGLLAVLDPDVVMRADASGRAAWTARRSCAAHRQWRKRSRDVHGPRNPRSSTAPSALWSRRAGSCCWCSTSRSRTEGSPQSR